MGRLMMDDVEEVGSVTEEDLRAAAMARVYQHRSGNPVLGPEEFTVADWIGFVEEEDGRVLDKSTARRELNDMEEEGIVASGERYDPRSRRSAIGFWYVETAGEEGAVPP